MGTPYLSEVRICGFTFAPKGWAACDGQLLPINQNQALFSLLGTTYGGDGRVNFALPDLRGRVPIHIGNGHVQGERAGEESHTLTLNELPSHGHTAWGVSADADQTSPANAYLARTPGESYAEPSSLVSIAPQALGNAGGSQPHSNLQPYVTLFFVIALQGIFPSPN